MSDYKTLSDSDLVALLRNGDARAYTEIYNRYYYFGIVSAFKKVRDEAVAKDIIQELFTNLWEKRENIGSIDNFAAYLFTAIRNKVFDFIAHQNVESKYIDSIVAHSTMSSESADHLIREKQLTIHIENAINELPIKMREVFELSRRSELSYKEIAEKLSISERTVNNQITNALARLRIKLGLFFILIFFIF